MSLLSGNVLVVGVGCINNARSLKNCRTAGSLIKAVCDSVNRDLLRYHNTLCAGIAWALTPEGGECANGLAEE